MIKYSVIVPVYNSEKTLARCLDSLTAQNRNDVQIIVVNDGSTDASDTIAREMAKQHPEIDYIIQENSGVSQARNAGIRRAEGTYITFVDSDDYVAPHYFETLDKAEDCDLLVFAHQQIGDQVTDDVQLLREMQKHRTMGDLLTHLLSSRKIMSPCNKRFCTPLIRENNLHFLPGMHTGEDFNFCMAYAVCCGSIQIAAESILTVDISDQTSLSRKYRPELAGQLKTVFAKIAATINHSELDEGIKNRLLAVTDYLFTKHVFSCISEEFKKKRLNYLKDRKKICGICEVFRQEFSKERTNLVHMCLRLALRLKMYYPFYLVSYWVKGRKYTH